MPLPKPQKNQKKSDFIKLCMSNKKMKEEFSDTKQRLAVCNTQWKESRANTGFSEFLKTVFKV